MTLLVGMGEFDLADIAETRQGLETLCCRLAAERRTDAQLATMAAELDIQRDPALSDVDFCASDVRFHRVLANATDNALLKFIMLTVIDALQDRVTNMVVYQFRERQRLVSQHESILAALQAHDADSAISRIERANRRSGRKVRSSLYVGESDTTSRADRRATAAP